MMTWTNGKYFNQYQYIKTKILKSAEWVKWHPVLVWSTFDKLTWKFKSKFLFNLKCLFEEAQIESKKKQRPICREVKPTERGTCSLNIQRISLFTHPVNSASDMGTSIWNVRSSSSSEAVSKLKVTFFSISSTRKKSIFCILCINFSWLLLSLI